MVAEVYILKVIELIKIRHKNLYCIGKENISWKNVLLKNILNEDQKKKICVHKMHNVNIKLPFDTCSDITILIQIHGEKNTGKPKLEQIWKLHEVFQEKNCINKMMWHYVSWKRRESQSFCVGIIFFYVYIYILIYEAQRESACVCVCISPMHVET